MYRPIKLPFAATGVIGLWPRLGLALLLLAAGVMLTRSAVFIRSARDDR